MGLLCSMIAYPRRARAACLAGAALLFLLAFSGCRTTHEVKIDAISDPAKPLGTSYRLVAIEPTGNLERETIEQAATGVRRALASKGMYEAPDTAKPDMVIFMEAGVGPGQMKIVYQSSGDPLFGAERRSPKPMLVHEKYIRLSAREPLPVETTPPANIRERRTRESKQGAEIWNVQVSIEDPKKELGPYIAVLTTASVDYIGTNSGQEKTLIVDAQTGAVIKNNYQQFASQ
jgi:hypothetical protein